MLGRTRTTSTRPSSNTASGASGTFGLRQHTPDGAATGRDRDQVEVITDVAQLPVRHVDIVHRAAGTVEDPSELSELTEAVVAVVATAGGRLVDQLDAHARAFPGPTELILGASAGGWAS